MVNVRKTVAPTSNASMVAMIILDAKKNGIAQYATQVNMSNYGMNSRKLKNPAQKEIG
jgi:hypothetical protein